jgi:hypothetical protein
MMNDTTFLLDESLSALTRIHEVQEDMEDPAKWAAQNQVPAPRLFLQMVLPWKTSLLVNHKIRRPRYTLCTGGGDIGFLATLVKEELGKGRRE